MSYIHWSTGTFLFYLLVGIFGAFCIYSGQKNKMRVVFNGKSVQLGYIILFLGFLGLASFRYIGNGLGGVDMPNYFTIFDNSMLYIRSIENIFLSDIEPLFIVINQIIHFISNNRVVYLCIMYGTIVISYVVFIKTYAPKKISYIPFIMLIYPFLKSFCTLRSSLAISFLLIGLSVYKKKKIFGILIMVSSFFVHKSVFLYIPFIIFRKLYTSRLKKMTKMKLLFFIIFYLISIYIVSNILKISFGSYFLIGNYRYYANSLNGTSIFSRIPLYFMQITLAVAILTIYKKNMINSEQIDIVEKENIEFIFTMCVYDILMIPASYMFGVWRSNEFFYLPRIIMWGIIIFNLKKTYMSNKSKVALDIAVFFVIIIWLYFRLSKEFYELGIMPYIITFFS